MLHEPSLKLLLSVTTTLPLEEYTMMSEVLSEETTPVDDITDVVDVGVDVDVRIVEDETAAHNSGSRHNTPPPVNELDNGQAQTIHETQTTN